MKHLFVLLSLLLFWGSAQAQNEKGTPVTKLPGEENLSVRERAERDFLMPVRRKKIVEAPKASTEDSAAPESDAATAHYAEATDEALPAHTTRSYEARHADALAARRAARREEARAEARAEARRAARHSSRSHSSKSSKSKSSKSKAHKSTSSKSKAKASKSKTKSKSAARSSKSKAKSSSHKAKSSKKSSAKKSTAHKSTKKSTPAKTKSKTKKRR